MNYEISEDQIRSWESEQKFLVSVAHELGHALVLGAFGRPFELKVCRSSGRAVTHASLEGLDSEKQATVLVAASIMEEILRRHDNDFKCFASLEVFDTNLSFADFHSLGSNISDIEAMGEYALDIDRFESVRDHAKAILAMPPSLRAINSHFETALCVSDGEEILLTQDILL